MMVLNSTQKCRALTYARQGVSTLKNIQFYCNPKIRKYQGGKENGVDTRI